MFYGNKINLPLISHRFSTHYTDGILVWIKSYHRDIITHSMAVTHFATLENRVVYSESFG